MQQNYAGRDVDRLGGPAYAVAMLGSLALIDTPWRIRLATAAAVGGAAAVGVYDDLVGDGDARGLAGHGKQLLQGQVTTGVVKVGVLGASGLVAGALTRDNWPDALTAGAVIAGCANLSNLLDLRPGRSAKVALATGTTLLTSAHGAVVASGLGGVAALLPVELAERTMLGDSGAGAVGALVGVGVSARTSSPSLRLILAFVSALIVFGEFVSYSAVIERVPVLRAIDGFGRRQ